MFLRRLYVGVLNHRILLLVNKSSTQTPNQPIKKIRTDPNRLEPNEYVDIESTTKPTTNRPDLTWVDFVRPRRMSQKGSSLIGPWQDYNHRPKIFSSSCIPGIFRSESWSGDSEDSENNRYRSVFRSRLSSFSHYLRWRITFNDVSGCLRTPFNKFTILLLWLSRSTGTLPVTTSK